MHLLIGSPPGETSWKTVEQEILRDKRGVGTSVRLQKDNERSLWLRLCFAIYPVRGEALY